MSHVDRVADHVIALVSEHSDEEDDLLERARQRDTRAFEQLYRLHVRRVYALCLRMSANERRAEELTQKTFLTAWEKLVFFRGESAFGSWLHRLAVNTVLSDFRAEQRRVSRVFGTADPTVFETAGNAPPVGVRLDLDQAISTLPTQARTIFVLHDVEGWKHEEIASRLGVATGTSKAQLHRARKLLQEALR
jgi:RNA polymerase sigma-70 factor, ECF subfamily